MPIIQIDWQELKEKFADVTAFYVFTHRQASLLLSLAEQLSWEKTFRDWGYDFGDKDALDLEIDDLRNNLMSPVNITDIIALIDDVENLLEDIRDASGGCCIDEDVTDGVQYTDDVDDGIGSVPQNIIDAGYATDAADWAGFADYKCMIAHQAIYTLETRLRVAAPWFGIGAGFTAILGSLAAIISAFFPTPAAPAAVIALGIIAAVAVTATLYKGLSDLGEDAIVALADDVDVVHDTLACAIYNSDGPDNAIDSLKSAIDDNFGVAEALVLKSLNVGPTIRALYAGRYDQINVAQELADRGYDTDDYDCSCVAPSGIFVAAVGAFVPMYSDDSGSNWQTMVGHEIVFGQEYWIESLAHAQDMKMAFNLGWPASNPIDVIASGIDYNIAPGNGLFWTARKADGTLIESGVLRTKDADYPFGYAQVWKIEATGNNINQVTYLKMTFTEF